MCAWRDNGAARAHNHHVNPSASRPLRYRLFLLAASGLIPLAIVALAVMAALVQDREAEVRKAALDVSRALATAVDAELRATTGTLQGLGEVTELHAEDIVGFWALARRVADAQGWRAIVLSDASGRVVMNSAVKPGAADPVPVEPESLQRAIATKQPVIGRLIEGPQRRGPAFAVRVPVLREGRVAWVLSAVVPTDYVLRLVTRQQVPEGWVVSIFDASGVRVARSRQHAIARASPSLQRMLDTGAMEGSGPTVTLEGVRSQTGFTRLPSSGWVVATGISMQAAYGSYLGLVGAVAAGLLGSLAFSAFLAWYFTRQVTRPIDALVGAAGALGRGAAVAVPQLGIAELQDVATALGRAAEVRDESAREREHLLERVTGALRAAEEAARSKDEFLAVLGHELRNPLAPIATALHLMDRKGDAATRREREIMQRQLAHMTRLVDDLLDVSRITGKRLTMRMAPVQLAEAVRHAAEGIRPVPGRRQLEVQVDREAEGAWVSADADRLAQILNNLLGNAVKFTGADGHIRLRVGCAGDTAQVEVRDDGVGMAPDELQRVFDLFYQAPQGVDRSRGGLGLGLAIVRSLVEMHGGRVRTESDGPGRGSRFAFELPRIEPPQVPAQDTGAAPGAGRGRVLLVDDNQDAVDTTATLLEWSGYEVQVAYDGNAALALLDRFQPQVAVLDIGLPGMSGYELAVRVHAHAHGEQCRLIALTGYGAPSDAEQARAAGFARHLVKPVAPDVLLAAIAASLPLATNSAPETAAGS